jgi:outer membrane protein assembly factor BamB
MTLRSGYQHAIQGLTALAIVGLIGPVATRAEVTTPRVDYEFTGDISLGAPTFNDYLTYDPDNRRLYVSHVDRVTVIDVATRTVVGSVAPFKDSHGIAIVPKMNKGYADSGDDGVVKVFNLTDFKITKQIKVSPDADGMLFDPHTGTVLVVAGDAKNLTVINPIDDTVTRVIGLPGKPEFMALDDAGNAYVNDADHASIVKVNIAAGTVEANWPLQNCKAPHGIAYDPPSHRLFSGCANGRLVVVDATDGRNVANLPTGSLSDGVSVDSTRRLVFTSNGPGTLTAISLGANDQYAVARTLPTFFGGRNMTLDTVTGTLYVTHGHMKIMSSMRDVQNLRFGWDGIEVATFEPRP